MLDPVLLRTFLAVADTASFTAAAARLGISQPTVSQHVRRLEESVGRRLFTRDTRDVRLTDNGDAMTGFARSILAAQAAAENYFGGAAMSGRLRFGAADDLAITQLPRILRQFRALHPRVNLELTVNQSDVLKRRLAAGHLDLVFVKDFVGATEGTFVGRDSLVWVAEERTEIDPSGPVPLIVYQAPSFSRTLAIEALEAEGRTWRITCNVREVNGLLAAVRAGLGVAVFPHSLLPADLVKVSRRFELPELGDIEYRLHSNPLAAKEPLEALTAAITAQPILR
ncbi:LysR substrate-binding domain-containing protein [Herbiconiux sp. L3-i23]|uniref:LysR substrate-binding domain-containing protein n=1 Tax=Herbiconiux sp. L3-i23 TaxID=2905871 RepID=UPI00205FE4E0|nr:LysR substrate-binding domain-containing protein [Herbiconiux sp. L3-i23]BDI22744.1 LysR family transcriptional regulator [Herbiconiux sp. L3-i23]